MFVQVHNVFMQQMRQLQSVNNCLQATTGEDMTWSLALVVSTLTHILVI